LGRHTSSKLFGYPSTPYKAKSCINGNYYVLRRIEGFRLINQNSMKVIEHWASLPSHPGIVKVHKSFTSAAFGDDSLIVVYDYHPASVTLHEYHFGGDTDKSSGGINNNNNTPGIRIDEVTLWSYITQLVSALKFIHSLGLACRILEPTKILVTGRNRIRINCVGIFDLLNFDGGVTTPHFQQDDLISLGHLIICLACNSLSSLLDISSSLEFISRTFGHELGTVVLYLLSKPSPMKKIDDVLNMLSEKMMKSFNQALTYNDYLEAELSKELENGRLVRLMTKLGFINERPEYGMDINWSETGDRYILKLFRDYVFHQVDIDARPVVDMAHVISCLNKLGKKFFVILDAGIGEKIMLISRDEQSCLIVSYKDLKRCVETSFNELIG
jgi:PAB-dependent poly(A)-specific ribonuclease subunit 3